MSDHRLSGVPAQASLEAMLPPELVDLEHEVSQLIFNPSERAEVGRIVGKWIHDGFFTKDQVDQLVGTRIAEAIESEPYNANAVNEFVNSPSGKSVLRDISQYIPAATLLKLHTYTGATTSVPQILRPISTEPVSPAQPKEAIDEASAYNTSRDVRGFVASVIYPTTPEEKVKQAKALADAVKLGYVTRDQILHETASWVTAGLNRGRPHDITNMSNFDPATLGLVDEDIHPIVVPNLTETGRRSVEELGRAQASAESRPPVPNPLPPPRMPAAVMPFMPAGGVDTGGAPTTAPRASSVQRPIPAPPPLPPDPTVSVPGPTPVARPGQDTRQSPGFTGQPPLNQIIYPQASRQPVPPVAQPSPIQRSFVPPVTPPQPQGWPSGGRIPPLDTWAVIPPPDATEAQPVASPSFLPPGGASSLIQSGYGRPAQQMPSPGLAAVAVAGRTPTGPAITTPVAFTPANMSSLGRAAATRGPTPQPRTAGTNPPPASITPAPTNTLSLGPERLTTPEAVELAQFVHGKTVGQIGDLVRRITDSPTTTQARAVFLTAESYIRDQQTTPEDIQKWVTLYQGLAQIPGIQDAPISPVPFAAPAPGAPQAGEDPRIAQVKMEAVGEAMRGNFGNALIALEGVGMTRDAALAYVRTECVPRLAQNALNSPGRGVADFETFSRALVAMDRGSAQIQPALEQITGPLKWLKEYGAWYSQQPFIVKAAIGAGFGVVGGALIAPVIASALGLGVATATMWTVPALATRGVAGVAGAEGMGAALKDSKMGPLAKGIWKVLAAIVAGGGAHAILSNAGAFGTVAAAVPPPAGPVRAAALAPAGPPAAVPPPTWAARLQADAASYGISADQLSNIRTRVARLDSAALALNAQGRTRPAALLGELLQRSSNAFAVGNAITGLEYLQQAESVANAQGIGAPRPIGAGVLPGIISPADLANIRTDIAGLRIDIERLRTAGFGREVAEAATRTRLAEVALTQGNTVAARDLIARAEALVTALETRVPRTGAGAAVSSILPARAPGSSFVPVNLSTGVIGTMQDIVGRSGIFTSLRMNPIQQRDFMEAIKMALVENPTLLRETGIARIVRSGPSSFAFELAPGDRINPRNILGNSQILATALNEQNLNRWGLRNLFVGLGSQRVNDLRVDLLDEFAPARR
ncbi:MAG: hypothetical protein AAB421_05400 [Patescibacteria group bacterium]